MLIDVSSHKKGNIKNEEAAFPPNYRSKNNITMQKKVVTVLISLV